MSKTGVNRCCM